MHIKYWYTKKRTATTDNDGSVFLAAALFIWIVLLTIFNLEVITKYFMTPGGGSVKVRLGFSNCHMLKHHCNGLWFIKRLPDHSWIWKIHQRDS